MAKKKDDYKAEAVELGVELTGEESVDELKELVKAKKAETASTDGDGGTDGAGDGGDGNGGAGGAVGTGGDGGSDSEPNKSERDKAAAEKKAAAEQGAKDDKPTTVKLKSPVKHNGKRYEAGAELQCSSSQARRLVAIGVAECPKKAKK